MNGVRRFLGGGQRAQSPPRAVESPPYETSPIQSTAPLSFGAKPTWPPSPVRPSQNGLPNGKTHSASSSTISASLPSGTALPTSQYRRNDSVDNGYLGRPSSPGSSSSSPPRMPVQVSPGSSPRSTMRVSKSMSGPSSPSRPLPSRVSELRPWKRGSGPVDTCDELLMSILASEAIVESRDFDILHSEDVEELKKERQVLESRVMAMQKRLKTEMKIRDAAASLAKVRGTVKNGTKDTTDHLASSTRKVETTQKELTSLSALLNEIDKKLLEHRAGVLSFSLKNLEAKIASGDDDSGYHTAFRSVQMSPTSSETSYASSKTKFEGPHLFAGHELAIPPMSPRKPVSSTEMLTLEDKVKELTQQLQQATDSQNEARREAAMLKVELEGLETSTALDLQSAEEKIASLSSDVQRVASVEESLRRQTAESETLRQEKQAMSREIQVLRQQLDEAQARRGETSGMESQMSEYQSAFGALKLLMDAHGLAAYSSAPPSQLIPYLGTHMNDMRSRVEAQQRQKEEWDSLRHRLEEDLRVGLDKREGLLREVEDARRERDECREKMRLFETRTREQLSTSESMKVVDYSEAPSDVKSIIDILKPVWNALPSPEHRASKFGARKSRSPGSISTPRSPNMSLSELDVRLLKTLYDGQPMQYALGDSNSQFSIDAFVARVQALIADDRALIERLVRFAQAHELLKQNADRAQKIAQDSSVALETYQKQVKALEERNVGLVASVSQLQHEIADLQETVEKVMNEKREVEMHAAQQAETVRQLSEANDSLSARTLSLAEEAASAPEAVRVQLEKQLAECKAELKQAQDDIHAMRTAEASQNLALLDELNHMQSENDNLRSQLRAIKK